jgi:hypothetical protein
MVGNVEKASKLVYESEEEKYKTGEQIYRQATKWET